MPATEREGRPNQKARTRKDLLQAAARLMKQGRKPTLEEIAEEAMVSRATAYRYFPGVEPLLVEAAIDVSMPDAEALMKGVSTDDPVARMERVDTAIHDACVENESLLRMMLAQSMERILAAAGSGDVPPRQNRRTPLIEAALEPSKRQFKPATLKNLSRALALVVGTEGVIVCKDVLQLEDAEARKVKRWAIRALVEAARRESGTT